MRKKISADQFDLRMKKNILTDETTRFPFYVKSAACLDKSNFSTEKECEFSDHFIFYNQEGRAELTCRGKTVPLYENSIVFSSCVVPVKITTQERKNRRFLFFVIGGQSVKLYYNMMRTDMGIFRMNPLSMAVDYMKELLEMRYDGSIYSNIQASAVLHNLLTKIYEIKHDILTSKEKIPVREMEVKRAVAFMTQNYARKDIGLETVCQEVCLSKYYFCKIFKQNTGFTVGEYLNQYRVNKSRDLLSFSKLTVDSIASSVGFSNPLTYIRNFKKEFLMTPSEYRRRF